MTKYNFHYEGFLNRLLYASCRSDIRNDEIYEIVVNEKIIRVRGDSIGPELLKGGIIDSSGVVRGPIKLDELVDLDIE